MAITSVQDRYNALIKAYQPSITDAINKSNAAYKGQSDVISQMYQTQIDEQGQQYDKLFDQNEVQRYINEQRIAENMANSGLTDSGLNRTQQTAVQLSYANNNAEIGRQRQSAVNALTQAMTAKLADIESARANAEMNIKSGYEQSAMKAAQDSYNTDVENARKQAELLAKLDNSAKIARINADAKVLSAAATATAKQQAKSNKLYTFSRHDANKDANIFRGSDGKEYPVKVGTNPYTGSNNIALGNGTRYGEWEEVKTIPGTSNAQKAVAMYGTFSNGYQPAGVVYDGKHYGKMQGILDTTTYNGKKQNVWYTKGESGITRYWIWDGEDNTYYPADVDKNTGKVTPVSKVMY